MQDINFTDNWNTGIRPSIEMDIDQNDNMFYINWPGWASGAGHIVTVPSDGGFQHILKSNNSTITVGSSFAHLALDNSGNIYVTYEGGGSNNLEIKKFVSSDGTLYNYNTTTIPINVFDSLTIDDDSPYAFNNITDMKVGDDYIFLSLIHISEPTRPY